MSLTFQSPTQDEREDDPRFKTPVKSHAKEGNQEAGVESQPSTMVFTDQKISKEKQICDYHPNEAAAYVCMDDSELLCISCAINEIHRDHEKIIYRDRVDYFHSKINSLDDCRVKIEQLMEDRNTIMSEGIETTINEVASLIYQPIQKIFGDETEIIMKWNNKTKQIFNDFEELQNDPKSVNYRILDETIKI